MKRVFAFIMAVLMMLIAAVSVGAVPADDEEPIDVYAQDVVFIDNTHYYPVMIHYRPAGSSSAEWQSEQMIWGTMSEWMTDVYCFSFPTDDYYTYYISDGRSDSRTGEFTYHRTGTMELYPYNETNGYGYHKVNCRIMGNSVFFTDNAGFDAPEICYCPSGATDIPSAWKSEPMTADGCSDYGEVGGVRYRFDFPREVFCFYITDGVQRTENIWFAGSMNVTTSEYNEDKNWFEVQCEALNVITDVDLFDTAIGGDGNNRYGDRLNEYLNTLPRFERLQSGASYKELYNHQDESGEIDWALLYVVYSVPDWSVEFGTVGNRAFCMGPHTPFRFGLALYDVREDHFYDLSEMKDYKKYDGLLQAIDNSGKGRLIGDIERDFELTILDVTIMQRCLAGICDYPEDDIAVMGGFSPMYYKETVTDGYHIVDEPIVYFSDFDRDGSRDITDATCLQRYLAGILTMK